ncbi:hypothetical protein GCM10023081_21300 [Arthrobacter ginkgonis]|uniref:Uncharacterized protein n=1 Tax=Arthrobacter ginkgonis TaxID=1630594 RepID=A0ABP7CAU5_9MICC
MVPTVIVPPAAVPLVAVVPEGPVQAVSARADAPMTAAANRSLVGVLVIDFLHVRQRVNGTTLT